ncbi:MAG TPA: DUF3999 family protein [Terracidiphilus sp.]|nr:DUF3999 family protein [Terracidiphilus sp.]HKF49349.1 DUF3999 family protein [Terracidiphilus sp.]
MKVIAVALLAAVATAPSPQFRYFRYERPIQLPANTSGQACVALDAMTFAHASQGLADLRIYRDGVESPYVIRKARPETTGPQTIDLVNPGTRGDKTVFDASMPSGAYSDLELMVSGHDFIATVTVLGGQRQDAVTTRVGEFTIFDLTGQRLGRSTVLHLPVSNFPFLHFEVDGPLAPAQFQSIAVERQAAETVRYVTVAKTAHVEQNGRNTVARFTVPAHVPIDRVVFVPPASPVNFSRDVEIAVTPERTKEDDGSRAGESSTWAGNILRIHRVQSSHRLDEEQLTVDSQGEGSERQAQWTVTVDNGDDAPIAFAEVRLEMVERDICFEAAPSGSRTLYYGDDALAEPRYDYAAWSQAGAASAAAALGVEQLNAGFQARPDSRPFSERHPLLLWAALLVVVGVLALVALRSAKKVERPG